MQFDEFAALQALEPRRLLSFTLVNTLLTVNGTAANNTIVIASAQDPKTGSPIIQLNDDAIVTTFPANLVRNVLINGLDGNDSIIAQGLRGLINAQDPQGIVGVTLTGGNGDDRLVGASGFTIFAGDAGNDLLSPVFGFKTFVFGSAGRDAVIYVNVPAGKGVFITLDETQNDGAGFDFISEDVELLIGSAGPDLIRGNGAANEINGGDGPDHLSGFGGNDTFNGGAGNDFILPGLGSDLISGGADVDEVAYNDHAIGVVVTLGDNLANDGSPGEADNCLSDIENVQGTAFNDSIRGTIGPNIFTALDGADTLRGEGGNDQLFGDTGNDLLEGLGGADQFFGGAGNDTVTYERYSQSVNASLDGVANDGQLDEHDNIIDVENIIGGNAGDVLSGNLGANVLRGNGGNDLIIPREGADIVDGGLGNDTIKGGRGADLHGGAGIDTGDYSAFTANLLLSLDDVKNDGIFLSGVIQSPDNIHSDIENLIGGSANDRLLGSALDNQISGNGGNDFILGNGGNDTLRGDLGNDTLLGTDGNDLLDGGPGLDSINGGNGDDTAVIGVNSIGDSINLGAGEDGVSFQATEKSDRIVVKRAVGPDGPRVVIELNGRSFSTLYLNGETVSVFGGAGNDHIIFDPSSAITWKAVFFGEAGNDHLIGASSDDTLDGGAGNDKLRGGGGNDVLR